MSDKTIWRRARRGELTARKVKGARGVLVWEIASNQCGQSNRPTGQTIPATNAANRPTSPEIEREASGQTIRTPNGQTAKATGQTDTTPDDTGARFMAHLEAENKFLRAALEQRDRDAAELRSALRAALKLTGAASVPQLTAGDAPAMPQPTPTAPPGARESGAVVNQGAANVESQQRGTVAQQSGGYDYGAIADKLEERLILPANG